MWYYKAIDTRAIKLNVALVIFIYLKKVIRVWK